MLEEEILREAKQKASLIREQARERAKAIREEAEKKALAIVEKATEEAEKEAEEYKKEELAKLKLEKRKLWAEAFEELYEKLLKAIRKNAKKVYEMPSYKAFLKRVYKSLPKDVELYLSKESQEILGVKAKTLKEPGLLAKSKDGSVVYDYTFSTLLKLKEPQIRALLYERVKG